AVAHFDVDIGDGGDHGEVDETAGAIGSDADAAVGAGSVVAETREIAEVDPSAVGGIDVEIGVVAAAAAHHRGEAGEVEYGAGAVGGELAVDGEAGGAGPGVDGGRQRGAAAAEE